MIKSFAWLDILWTWIGRFRCWFSSRRL